MATTVRIDRKRSSSNEERAAVERLNEEAKNRWFDPTWQQERAAIIADEILRGFEHESIIDTLVDTSRVGHWDRITMKEVRGMRAFWVARGGYIEASTIHSEVAELPRDRVGFHVYDNLDKLQSDYATSQADMIDLAIQRMDATVQARMLAVLQAAIPSGDYYISGAGLSLTALNAAIRGVQDRTRVGQVNIVGRATMVQQIMDKLTLNANGQPVGFLPETNEAMIRGGVLGTYRGARIIQLRNYLDDMDLPFWPANELYVYATDMGKAGFFGGMTVKTWDEDEVDYTHARGHMEVGFMIHHPDRARRIVDTSISATS